MIVIYLKKYESPTDLGSDFPDYYFCFLIIMATNFCSGFSAWSYFCSYFI